MRLKNNMGLLSALWSWFVFIIVFMVLSTLNPFIGIGFVVYKLFTVLTSNSNSQAQQTTTTRRREPIPQYIKDQVWQRDNGRCIVCGSNRNIEFDHIIPYSKGGKNTYRNLQLLCEFHNRQKGDEYYE